MWVVSKIAVVHVCVNICGCVDGEFVWWDAAAYVGFVW